MNTISLEERRAARRAAPEEVFERTSLMLSGLCGELARERRFDLDEVLLDGGIPGVLKGEHMLELFAGSSHALAWIRRKDVLDFESGANQEPLRTKLKNVIDRLQGGAET